MKITITHRFPNPIYQWKRWQLTSMHPCWINMESHWYNDWLGWKSATWFLMSWKIYLLAFIFIQRKIKIETEFRWKPPNQSAIKYSWICLNKGFLGALCMKHSNYVEYIFFFLLLLYYYDSWIRGEIENLHNKIWFGRAKFSADRYDQRYIKWVNDLINFIIRKSVNQWYLIWRLTYAKYLFSNFVSRIIFRKRIFYSFIIIMNWITVQGFRLHWLEILRPSKKSFWKCSMFVASRKTKK